MLRRAIAIIAPGMFLSHPPTASTPSIHCAAHTVSTESAITSRETSEYFIPSVPIEIPSLTVIVPNNCGITPSVRSEEHTSELQSPMYLVCRLLLEKKKNKNTIETDTSSDRNM